MSLCLLPQLEFELRQRFHGNCGRGEVVRGEKKFVTDLSLRAKKTHSVHDCLTGLSAWSLHRQRRGECRARTRRGSACEALGWVEGRLASWGLSPGLAAQAHPSALPPAPPLFVFCAWKRVRDGRENNAAMQVSKFATDR